MTQIIYTKYGLGNYIGNKIYLNKLLLKYPKLHDKIVKHELEHAKGNDDIDLNSHFDSELLKFTLKHPSTWIHFFPIFYR